MKKILLFLCGFIFLQANAATVINNHNSLIITGYLDVDDYKKIENEIIAKNTKLIVLKFCTGGNALVGLKLARLVHKLKIYTANSGWSSSACALIYLAGKKRGFFTDEDLTILTIHGMRSLPGKNADTVLGNQKYIDFMQNTLNLNLSKKTIDIIKNTTNEYEGIYFIQNNRLKSLGKSVFYCNATREEDLAKNCKIVEGVTFESEGIIKK
jgi:ATP-dependent protease ClpP protease subunit